MSFNCSDVQDIAEREVDDSIDDEDVVSFVNSCFMDYVEQFRKTDIQTINVTDTSQYYARSAGHLAVVKITADGEDYTGEYEFSHDRTEMTFEDTGNFVVTSLVLPTEVTSINDTIQVHEVFKNGVTKYVAGLFKLKDNDQNPDGLRMLGQAESLIRKAASLLTMPDRRPGQRIPIKRSAGNWNNM